MALREGNLLDYLVASFIGVAVGLTTTGLSVGAIGNWGLYIGCLFVSGIFSFIPGGITAAYINFRLHKMGDNKEMAGVSAAFFAAIVLMIMTLATTITAAIMNTAAAGNYFIAWILATVFGFLFFIIGGFLAGTLERRPFAMPSMFDLSKLQRGPPPPPAPGGAVQTCPTCGQPMTFVQQYGRWYCGNCKRYP